MSNAYRKNTRCYICNFPIPLALADPVDPLFGTIDHVNPKARGGTDCAENRKPSHRYCNLAKGQNELTDELIEHCKSVIAQQFVERPHFISGVRKRKRPPRKINGAAKPQV